MTDITNGLAAGSPEEVERNDMMAILAMGHRNQTPPNLPAARPPQDMTAPEVGSTNTNALSGLEAPPVHETMAQGIMAAMKQSDGKPGDWAKAVLSGTTSALAGVGNIGKVPEGAGALYGIGKVQQANQQRQDEIKREQAAQAGKNKQLDLEQQRVTNEKSNQDRDYTLKTAESARQQAESVARLSEHDKRMTQMDDEHKQANFVAMHEDVTFRQQELDRENALKQSGAKPLQIGGAAVPAFDDLGQLEKYATQNHSDVIASHNGYNTRPVLGADNKYRLYEIPDTGPTWQEYTDASGKKQRAFATPAEYLNLQEKVAMTRHLNAEATHNLAQATKEWDERKDEGTVKAARRELTKVDGDYTKLSAGSKEALSDNAQKRYDLAYNKYIAGIREMRKDPRYFSLKTDVNGNPDTNTDEYKDLQGEYHIQESNQDVASSYDELRQLGHSYKAPGSTPQLPKPGKAGAAIDGATFQQFLKANGGDFGKAKQAAIEAGWGAPAQAAAPEAAEVPTDTTPRS